MRRPIQPNELNFFYQKTGEAILHLQHVEHFLSQLYFMKAKTNGAGSISQENADREMAILNKKTLGQLIGLVESENLIPAGLLGELKNFNRVRKWVVHNSNRESGNDLYTDEGRARVIRKIMDFVQQAIELQKLIQTDLTKFSIKAGISESLVQKNGGRACCKTSRRGLASSSKCNNQAISLTTAFKDHKRRYGSPRVARELQSVPPITKPGYKWLVARGFWLRDRLRRPAARTSSLWPCRPVDKALSIQVEPLLLPQQHIRVSHQLMNRPRT